MKFLSFIYEIVFFLFHTNTFIKLKVTKEQLKLLSMELSDNWSFNNYCKKLAIFLMYIFFLQKHFDSNIINYRLL